MAETADPQPRGAAIGAAESERLLADRHTGHCMRICVSTVSG